MEENGGGESKDGGKLRDRIKGEMEGMADMKERRKHEGGKGGSGVVRGTGVVEEGKMSEGMEGMEKDG